MGQAIQSSRGHDVFIGKDLSPVGEGLVAIAESSLFVVR